jgi:uroporphyrinogen-III decarboxylase
VHGKFNPKRLFSWDNAKLYSPPFGFLLLPGDDSHMNKDLLNFGYDVVTIDGSFDLTRVRDTFPDEAGLQGGFNPNELIDAKDGCNTRDTVRASARELLETLGPQRLIANLSEGLSGKESPVLVKAFVDSIHTESERLIQLPALREEVRNEIKSAAVVDDAPT